MSGDVPVAASNNHSNGVSTLKRSESISQASATSQTAQEYIRSQLQLEQEAREALPYQFDTCTKPLGPLRQTVFSCLTCNPPDADPSVPYNPAGLCYSCSISCHGEHELVELFARRNFECDCGTSRLPASSLCSLRLNAETGLKGGVHSEEPAAGNKYNHNFKNRFCGCGDTYDAQTEKGTMFQCLGLATEEDGGCGEDWWHPECLLGLPRNVQLLAKNDDMGKSESEPDGASENLNSVNTESLSEAPVAQGDDDAEIEDPPLPPGFPAEEAFEHLICYKCANAVPWIKAYAGHAGFLPAVLHANASGPTIADKEEEVNPVLSAIKSTSDSDNESRKRKVEEEEANSDFAGQPPLKKQNLDANDGNVASAVTSQSEPKACSYPTPPPSVNFKASLFLEEDFRDHLCHCPQHFPLLTALPFLLEEEETHEPPVSEGSEAAGAGAAEASRSEGSRSLYDRGEAALSTVDRVRALEGVMAYNHLRDKVKDFLKPFAESGQAVGAEDVKAYFEKLRGDDLQALRGGSSKANGHEGNEDGEGGEADHRKEQGGY